MTTTVDPHRYVLRNYCRKECNVVGDPDGGHMERHAGGPWMLAADVLPVLEELRRALTAEAKQAERLRQALVHSVSLIQEWHNMGMSPKVASDTWDIYWRNAPELKPIRAAMEKANG